MLTAALVSYEYLCRQWFDTRVGDGHIERVLPVAADAGKLVPYVFNISTSDLRGAGTDAGGPALYANNPSMCAHMELNTTHMSLLAC
jgi:hypothetical protein